MWAKAFEGIDTSATNAWYVGTGLFQAALLSSSLQSMNANISSAIAFSPSSGSSSGFGGGDSRAAVAAAAAADPGEEEALADMPKLCVRSLSISIDGYAAGP